MSECNKNGNNNALDNQMGIINPAIIEMMRQGKFAMIPSDISPAKQKTELPAWTCVCGNINNHKFCEKCGAKKPKELLIWQCAKCGWTPEDSGNPPKFCIECGDPFTEDEDHQ